MLVVSVDGLKPESYTEPDAHGLKVPTLREMVRGGAWSEGALPVLPTVTYPSHTTMVTGVNPGTHGIVTNHAWDPLNQNYGGWRWYTEDIRVLAVWQLARQRGLRTALIHWPVTVGAEADLNVPEFWRADDAEDLKLLRVLSTPGVLEDTAKEFPDFSKNFIPPDQTDSAFTDIAIHAVRKLRPNLLLLHIAQVDHWEHEKGPFSPEANAVIETADVQIARLIAAAKQSGIWEGTAIMVLSDHGFAPISQAFHPGVLLRQHDLITLDAENRVTAWKACVITDGGSAYIYVNDPSDAATRRTLLDLFTPLAGKAESGVRRIIGRDEIVAWGGDPNAFLSLEAADGFQMAFGYTGDLIGPANQRGTHGYFPDRPEMRTSLLIYGPKIVPGKIENARLIDVAPTIARWLGLKLPNAEGTPLSVFFRAASNPSKGN